MKMRSPDYIAPSFKPEMKMRFVVEVSDNLTSPEIIKSFDFEYEAIKFARQKNEEISNRSTGRAYIVYREVLLREVIIFGKVEQ